MEMEISFGEKTVIITVYVKLLAPDKLLLSETVYHGITAYRYHASIQLMEKREPIDGKAKNIGLKTLEKVQTTGEDQTAKEDIAECQKETDLMTVNQLKAKLQTIQLV